LKRKVWYILISFWLLWRRLPSLMQQRRLESRWY